MEECTPYTVARSYVCYWGGGGGVPGGNDKCKQYDGLGMRPMRPHCVKYVCC